MILTTPYNRNEWHAPNTSIMLILTGGKPASLTRSANLYNDNGVISDVFKTTRRKNQHLDLITFSREYLLQLPVPRAGANFLL